MEQLIKDIQEILKILLPLLIASLPGIYSLIQNERDKKTRKGILSAEEKKVTVDATEKLALAAGNVQDIYQGIITDIKNEMGDCKTKLDIVLEQMEKLRLENEELKRLVRVLETKVASLIKQLKDRDIDPVVE